MGTQEDPVKTEAVEEPKPSTLADYDKWLREAELGELEKYRKGTGPAPLIYRANGRVQESTVEDGQPTLFVASDEAEDRTGWVITAAGWELEHFQKSPVFLYMHDQSIPPIGRVAKIWAEGKQLLAHVRFDEQDDFAKMVQGKYRRGFMQGVSVGFNALDFEERQGVDGKRGILFKRQELVELSAVPVPANALALKRALGSRPFWAIPTEQYIQRIEALEQHFAHPVADENIDIDMVALSRRVWKE